MSKKPSVGRIVHYFPGTNEVNKLPNGMTHAPGIITQTFGDNGMVNMTLFLAETDVNKNATPQKWSVSHKSQVGNDEQPHWEWPTIE